MTLSSFIDINSKRYKFDIFKMEVKDMVNDKIVKLRATNGIDEQLVIKHVNVTNKEASKRYYQTHKKEKKAYAKANKERIRQYMKNYYLIHKQELNRKNRERYENSKIKKIFKIQ
jgi:hypothetical protein